MNTEKPVLKFDIYIFDYRNFFNVIVIFVGWNVIDEINLKLAKKKRIRFSWAFALIDHS